MGEWMGARRDCRSLYLEHATPSTTREEREPMIRRTYKLDIQGGQRINMWGLEDLGRQGHRRDYDAVVE